MRVLIGALVLCVCAWGTHRRAQDWRSDEALWLSAARTHPFAARPALQLARVYVRLGRWADAETWTARTVANLRPRDAWFLDDLCRHIETLTVFAPAAPSFAVECAS